MKFSELLKKLRLEKKLTLRECALKLEVDPSNWSKMERGINPAPKHRDILKRWATFFKLTDRPKQEFFDTAALSRHEIPYDIASDETLLSKMPAFFRSIRGAELNDRELREFVKEMRELYTRDAEKQDE